MTREEVIAQILVTSDFQHLLRCDTVITDGNNTELDVKNLLKNKSGKPLYFVHFENFQEVSTISSFFEGQ